MSALYGTMSSEKATKYQGGNKKIAASVTAEVDGNSIEVVRLGVAINENGGYDIFARLCDGREIKTSITKKQKTKNPARG